MLNYIGESMSYCRTIHFFYDMVRGLNMLQAKLFEDNAVLVPNHLKTDRFIPIFKAKNKCS